MTPPLPVMPPALSSPPFPPAELISRALRRSWLPQPPPLSLSPEEFAAAVPLLAQTHAHILAWWRIRDSPLAETELGDELADAFRLTALGNAITTRHLINAVQQLRAGGIEPLLVKGWAIARHYPSPGLRPLGDIDLFVPKEEIPRARQLSEEMEIYLDIQHTPFYDEQVFARDYAALMERAETCVIDGVPVRVPGPEDHLRLLCIHMLDHGAWRPLWLTDVAVALETRPKDFDWDRVLHGPSHVADWVLSAVALAHLLLDAPISGTPAEAMLHQLPRWLVPTVLHHWSLGSAFAGREPLASLLPRQWRRPSQLVEAIRLRWPDPIRASMFCRVPFDNAPRFPYQLRTALASLPLIYREFRRRNRTADP